MEPQVQMGYDSLVPTDQYVIDAMILALVKKDKQIKDLVDQIHKMLDKENEDG